LNGYHSGGKVEQSLVFCRLDCFASLHKAGYAMKHDQSQELDFVHFAEDENSGVWY
jgi:hypothetical protein